MAKVIHNGVEYNVLDPASIKWAERDDFIKKLVSVHTPPAAPTEENIIQIYADQRGGRSAVKVDAATVAMARDYIKYRDKGARLPKFSRWATGMFADNKQLAADLAAAGKYVEKSANITISGDMIDILRCSDTPHFYSCFKLGDAYDYMPRKICEETPGICIAYVDDDKKKMRGRVWVHHAVRVDNGNEVAVVCQNWGGTLPAKQVAEAIKKLGIEALYGSAHGEYAQTRGVKVKFINCFDKAVHHDLYTWQPDFHADPV